MLVLDALCGVFRTSILFQASSFYDLVIGSC